jgi:hypothetical protein
MPPPGPPVAENISDLPAEESQSWGHSIGELQLHHRSGLLIWPQGFRMATLLLLAESEAPTVGLEPTTTRLRALRSAG